MDLGLFLGRFHPLVVHLPIGFILLAFIFQWLSGYDRFSHLKKSVSLTLLLGALSAILAVGFGFLISGDRGYDDSTLFWHRLLGILVTIIAILLWIIEAGYIRISRMASNGLYLASVLFISLTGHLGGSLTHGEGYLTQYAPEFIRNVLEAESSNDNILANLPDHPDSVIIYNDIIHPIIQTRCMPCHTSTQKKGGLDLTTYEALKEGGESGAAIVSGKPRESELFSRITLPVNHAKFMPLKETPLDFTEIRLIEWWIKGGGSDSAKMSDYQMTEQVAELLKRDFKFDVTPKPYYEVTQVETIDQKLLSELSSSGIKARPLSAKNNYLDVSLSPDTESFTDEHLDLLMDLKDHITWLDLNGKVKDPKLVSSLNEFSNLTRLNIGNNSLTDTDVSSLSSLAHLESLNLYGTSITNLSVEIFSEMKSLKRLYTWQTEVSSEAIAGVESKRPELDIINGFQ